MSIRILYVSVSLLHETKRHERAASPFCILHGRFHADRRGCPVVDKRNGWWVELETWGHALVAGLRSLGRITTIGGMTLSGFWKGVGVLWWLRNGVYHTWTCSSGQPKEPPGFRPLVSAYLKLRHLASTKQNPTNEHGPVMRSTPSPTTEKHLPPSLSYGITV